MSKKWFALLCAAALVISLGVAAYASGEASGTLTTRGSAGPVEVPETAAEWIASAFSCRSFTDEAVPDELVEEIVAAGINAPSAINTQPWKFIIVKDETLKTALVNAPAVVIVAVPVEDYNMGGNSQFAAGTAAESMYLYAQAVGLGAHMYTAPVAFTINASEESQVAYAIPEGYEAAVVLAFGYYDDYVDAASSASVRNDYDSFVTVIE